VVFVVITTKLVKIIYIL